MRRVFVFVSLVGMLGLTAAVVSTREQPDAPEAKEEVASTEADASEPDSKATEDEGPKTASSTGQLVAGIRDPSISSKPLHVVALGWEVLAPGMLANEGMLPGEKSTFAAAGLDVDFTAVDTAEQIETRLGRGGEAKDGADIALMPLPVFVASYERLQALSPQVFFVVAWSRGRDALVGHTPLDELPSRGTVFVHGQPGSSEALLGLFGVSQAGTAASRVRITDDPTLKNRAALRTELRRKSRQIDARDLLLSTADATHLIPVVAVAPRGVVERRRADLVAWSKVWMEGAKTLKGDPAAAARSLATASGAPEAVDLIDALGWLEFTDLAASARAAGLSGRSAVDLDVLFHHTWGLWREVGLLTTPPPLHVPLTATVIAELAHSAPVAGPDRPQPRQADGADTLLTRTMPGRRLKADGEAALVGEIGFLAGVFSRSKIEVWVPRSPDAAARVTTQAIERFGLDAKRVVARTDRDPKARKSATISVSAAR